MTQTKSEWRALLSKARTALGNASRRQHSSAILGRCAALPEFEASRTLVLYEALGAEVDPHGLADSATASGTAVCFPGNDPYPSWVTRTGRVRREAGDLARPVLIVVPGIGFDRYGTRLGRGRGYYDRALAELRERGPIFAVGVAFEVQIVPRLPCNVWDQPVDLVVTEKRRIVPLLPTGKRHARHGAKEACEQ